MSAAPPLVRDRASVPPAYVDARAQVGDTPSIRVRVDGVDRLHVKLEGANPTGSVKDRACVWMLDRMLLSPDFSPDMTILDASSGNMACSIAYFGRLLALRTMLVVNSKLTEEKRDFLEYYGASVHAAGNFTIEGNRYCRVLAAESPGTYYFLDQLHNWSNARAHYHTTGPELVREFPDLEMVVGSLGSGGTMLGVGEFVRRARPETRIVAVEAAPGTRIPGTGAFSDGDYVSPLIERARAKLPFDATVQVSEAEAWRAAEILRDQGVFAGLQAGAVVHAAIASVNRWGVTGEVVAIAGDTGWKNMRRLVARARDAGADGRTRR
jgi:cysteine synthase